MSDDLISQESLVLLSIAIAVGVSVALIAWLVSRTLVEVPSEDREFKDPPPLGFRLLWWPIQWLSHFLDSVIPNKMRGRVAARLLVAGLEFTISPAQFQAARMIGAVALASIACLVLSLFEGPDRGVISTTLYGQIALLGACGGWFYPAIWLRDRTALRKRELLKSLPFLLDIITLCVEAGLNMQGAMAQAVAKGPKGVLRSEFLRVLRDIRAGKQRAEALRAMAARLREPSITAFTTAVIQAESMGMSLGPVLRAQADQRRAERFLRAEKMAMEAPVKMLFPLIAFIFPCTFIVLFFPIVIKFMHSGL